MYEYNCKVLRVLDGDTLDVDIDLGFSITLRKQRIRMYGIDTPESRTRDKEEKVRGLLSKDFLKGFCPVDGTIVLISHGKGKFGRILGEIFTDDGLCINDHMIHEGYAVRYQGGNKEELDAMHQANKEKLIAEGVLTV